MRSRRQTIGVMIDNVDDDYQRSIWYGIERAAEEYDLNVMNFLCGDFGVDSPGTLIHNKILKLVSPEVIDGIIIVSSVMASYIGNHALEEYCVNFKPLPMVSFGFVLESMPSVITETQYGLRDLIEHLIIRHGKKHFMFVGGTRYNSDAIMRKKIFEEALEQYGISMDPHLMLRGDFKQERTIEVIKEVLSKGYRFDAVVCANDEMAISVMTTLQESGIRVPEEVSVTGFDDILGAHRLSMPLTTVRQQLSEMARKAVSMLIDTMSGKNPPEIITFPTEVIIRRSCGCYSQSLNRAGEFRTDLMNSNSSNDGSVDSIISELLTIYPSMSGNQILVQIRELTSSFLQECSDKKKTGKFISDFDHHVRAALSNGMEDDLWEDFLTIIRKTIFQNIESNRNIIIEAGSLIQQARVMLKEISKQQLWSNHSALAKKTLTLQFVIDNLIGSFDLPTLLNNLAEELPKIGIKGCFLSLHDNDTSSFTEARMILAYRNSIRTEINPDGYPYQAKLLFPDNISHFEKHFEKRINLIWQPLIFGNEELGFIGLEYNPLEEISSLALAEQIRSALKASLMMQEISQKDKKLLTLDQMKNDFIANITHDFRSLISITMNTSWLGMESTEKKDPEQLKKYFRMSYEASLKLKVAIDRLLDLASMDERGLALKIHPVNICLFLKELIDFYSPVLSVSGIELKYDLPDNEVEQIYTDSDKVEEIMHNLISNAAKFVEFGNGLITISLLDKESTVEIIIKDNGTGIAKERLETIFDRFKKRDTGETSSQKATGIGLSFVRQLSLYLKGSIRAESEGPDKGAKFILSLPKGREVFEDFEIVEKGSGSLQTSSVRSQFLQLIETDLRSKRGNPSIS